MLPILNVSLLIDAAIRELVHGLGFINSLVDYTKVYASPTPFFGPLVKRVNETTFDIQPPTAFDKQVWVLAHERDFMLLHLFEPFCQFGAQNVRSISEYVRLMRQEPFVNQTGLVLSQMNTIFETEIKQRDQELGLEDLSFVHGSYLGTEEFLLTPAMSVGVRLEDLIDFRLFGPKTLMVMEQMGYATHENPWNMPELVYLP